MWLLLGAALLLLPLLLAVGGRGSAGAPLAGRLLQALLLLSLLHLPSPLPEGLLLLDGRIGLATGGWVTEGLTALLLGAFLTAAPAALPRAEHGLLLACYVGGLLLLPWSQDLLLTFFALQLANLTLYLLLGSYERGEGTLATSLKYLLLSALASALLLLGILLLFTLHGATELGALALLARGNGPLAGHLLAVGLCTLGLLLKLGVAPFHLWGPDVYGSAPTLPAALLLTLPKLPLLLTLAALLPLLPSAGWEALLLPPALLSLLVGTVGMGGQRTVRRWIAFSSLAHGGYLLLLLGSGAIGATLFYALTYLPATALLLSLLLTLRERGSGSLGLFAGLGLRHPALLLPLLLALLSLLGLPPLAGFAGKLLLLGALLGGGGSLPAWVAAASVVVASLLGAAYYLRVVRLAVVDLPLLPLGQTDRAAGPLALTGAGATVLAALTLLLIVFTWKPASLLTLVAL